MDKYDENLEKLINEFKNFSSDTDENDMNVRLSDTRSKPVKAVALALFSVTLLGLFVLGLITALRPAISELEKRSLAKFPEFSMESFLNGDYFADISLWYSDTYPFRENILTAQNRMTSLYGFAGDEQIVGPAGNNDDIPESYARNDETKEHPTDTDESREPVETAPIIDGKTIDESVPAETDEELHPAVSPYENEVIQKTGSVYIAGNSAHRIFYFNLDGTNDYIDSVNAMASYLDGVANVYTALVPISTGVMLSKEQQEEIGSADIEAAINYCYNAFDPKIKKLDVFGTLSRHKDEYIFFRTDHHWTVLGAYYTYLLYCEAAGLTPVSLDDLREVKFEGFLGTYYTSSGQNAALEATPDTVYAYKPNGVEDMYYYNTDLIPHQWPIIKDMTDSSPYSKYQTFIAGDHALTIIVNPTIEDDSSLIIYKDSFANPLVTLLANNYHKIYVVDNRYITVDAKSYCMDNGIKDCIILYGIDSVSSSTAKLLRNNVVNPQ